MVPANSEFECAGSKLAYTPIRTSVRIRFADGVATLVGGVDPSTAQRAVAKSVLRLTACRRQRGEARVEATVELDVFGAVRRVSVHEWMMVDESCVLRALGAPSAV